MKKINFLLIVVLVCGSTSCATKKMDPLKGEFIIRVESLPDMPAPLYEIKK